MLPPHPVGAIASSFSPSPATTESSSLPYGFAYILMLGSCFSQKPAMLSDFILRNADVDTIKLMIVLHETTGLHHSMSCLFQNHFYYSFKTDSGTLF